MKKISPDTITQPTEKQTPKELAVLLTLVGIAGRLLPHWPNVTPVGGLSVWGGTRLNRTMSFVVILIAMLVSDLFLGFHKTMPYVYGSLLLTTYIASLIKKPSVWNVGGVTLLGTMIFFLTTNFGTWATSTLYPHTGAGLLAAYAAGLSFLRLSFLGDTLYTAAFFGLEWTVLTLAAKSSIVNTVNK